MQLDRVWKFIPDAKRLPHYARYDGLMRQPVAVTKPGFLSLPGPDNSNTPGSGWPGNLGESHSICSGFLDYVSCSIKMDVCNRRRLALNLKLYTISHA
jgi:hypothetical protein